MGSDIGPKIGINGEREFLSSLRQINGEFRTTKTEIAAVTSAYDKNDKSVETLAKKNKELEKVLADLEAQQVQAKLAVAEASDAFDKNSNAVQKAQQHYSRVTAEVNNVRNEMSGMADATDKNADAINELASALAAAGVVAGLKEIADALWSCVDASVDFESAMAGVFKTVDGTETQLQAISDDIKELSTIIPASTTELAGIAEAAGQLGIATDDILGFTEVMAKLGTSTNMSAEDAATALARFANITGTSADNYERLGSTIVALGNNFATSESEITEMATRLASAGTIAGLTETDILALSAAMSSVGINAEAGGTAMTQTLTAIEKAVVKSGSELNDFAKIAGMSADGFKNAWNKDAISAVQAFISGLGGLEKQGESATLVLEDLGLSGIRQSNMLKSLSLASGELSKAIGLSSTAWNENIALAEEAALRYETTESKFQLLENSTMLLKQAIGDALTPALGELAETGADAAQWAADFVANNEDAVKGVTALTVGLGAFVGVMTTTAAVVPIAKKAIDALNVSLKANPAGLYAAAIVGVITALTALSAAFPAAQTEGKRLVETYKTLRQEAQATSEAYDSTIKSITNSAESTSVMVDRVTELAEKANKTDAELYEMTTLIEHLNKSVPGLNLSYDELNGTLSMTAEQIRAVTEAQAYQTLLGKAFERRIELAVEEQSHVQSLAEVTEALAKANEDVNNSFDPETRNDARKEVFALEAAERKLTEQLETTRSELAQIDANTESYSAALENNTATVEENTDKADEAATAAVDYAEKIKELTSATGNLTKENSRLTNALSEQESAGTLNLSTINDLIDSGYALALQIDEETGAVTLDKEAYIALAAAKIEEQIASAKINRAALVSALANEAVAAQGATIANLELAQARYAARAAASEELKAFDAQIAALEEMQSNLGKTTTAVKAYGGASKKATDAAEEAAKDSIRAYQNQKKELDHLKKLNLVDEDTYYKTLAKYRDEYLTDDSNVDEYRRVTEEIYSYQEDMLEETLKAYKANLDGIEAAFAASVAETEKLIEEVVAKQEAMESKLSNYGDLFSWVENANGDEFIAIGNLEEQIAALEKYADTLDMLEEAGVSEGLMTEIIGMDVDDAIAYGEALLAMGEGIDDYVALWEEKQQAAQDIARRYYDEEIEALETLYNDQLEEALSSMRDTAFTSGEDTIQSLIDGMAQQEESLYAKVQEIINNVNSQFDGALGAIADGSFEYPDFSMSVTQNTDDQTAALLNGLGAILAESMTAAGTTESGESAVYLDGIEVGRVLLPTLRELESSSPEIRDDFI